jgi:hypothetical protein
MTVGRNLENRKPDDSAVAGIYIIRDLGPPFLISESSQHRLVYQVLADVKTVKVIRLWSHYE